MSVADCSPVGAGSGDQVHKNVPVVGTDRICSPTFIIGQINACGSEHELPRVVIYTGTCSVRDFLFALCKYLSSCEIFCDVAQITRDCGFLLVKRRFAEGRCHSGWILSVLTANGPDKATSRWQNRFGRIMRDTDANGSLYVDIYCLRHVCLIEKWLCWLVSAPTDRSDEVPGCPDMCMSHTLLCLCFPRLQPQQLASA